MIPYCRTTSLWVCLQPSTISCCYLTNMCKGIKWMPCDIELTEINKQVTKLKQMATLVTLNQEMWIFRLHFNVYTSSDLGRVGRYCSNQASWSTNRNFNNNATSSGPLCFLLYVSTFVSTFDRVARYAIDISYVC